MSPAVQLQLAACLAATRPPLLPLPPFGSSLQGLLHDCEFVRGELRTGDWAGD
eukprot:CAMPEP_0119102248 /NCGR_PEP_ID=MMETSP1180-20130426/1055_1 /TAXON_ID=3052 ORGANISM="Chlamydomonas cf sp, Strain CCMP681" /NCGR_SAMPLE_ID=MMETSP1180 /ASSEMBLY_ACC=CAM_ASM_000741 /LENGTH=52 /DNA_ID=CAMNT_0007086497 /DNA_START=266 /DNA_END=424 /DNA_ORIENTATION=+